MAAKDIPYNGPVTTDSSGVLAVFVQQPVDNTPSVEPSGTYYTEKWKGPYSRGKDVTSGTAGLGSGATLAAFHSWLGVSRVSRFTAPLPPVTTVNGVQYTAAWKADSIRVTELVAGDHCEIVARFYAYFDFQEGSTELKPAEENKNRETWSIEWMSYSVSPYAFLSNKSHAMNVISLKMLEDPDSAPTLDTEEGDRLFCSMWQMHNGSVASGDRNNLYWWREDPSRAPGQSLMYQLNYAEAAVMKKAKLDRSAVYHYPVVTHTTVYEGYANSTYSATAVGDGLDTVTALPSGCPYQIAGPTGSSDSSWKWMLIDDSVQAESGLNIYISLDDKDNKDDSKKKSTSQPIWKRIWTRRQKWAGYTEVDENFYGSGAFSHAKSGIDNGRWKLGAL